jgi:predicted transport protein
MSDLKLFRIGGGKVAELTGSSMALEKHLQHVIEQNMETLFGVRFLASEYSTGHKHRGRIDSIGIDENDAPVIFEYKRASNENVVNQGLFYLDWLLDHKAEFTLLVMQRIGAEQATAIDWLNPRLVCVAGDFTRYDEHAVQQINRSIELVRYRDFGGELLALELLTAAGTAPSSAPPKNSSSVKNSLAAKNITELLAKADDDLANLYSDLDARLVALGDDVQKTVRQDYFAYKRLKNFACVEVHPKNGVLLVYLKVNPDTVDLVKGFSRDVRHIGHFGTGDLELRIMSSDDLARAEPYVRSSYEAS